MNELSEEWTENGIERQKTLPVSELQMQGIQQIASQEFQQEYIDSINLRDTSYNGMPAALRLARLQKQYVESLLQISGGVNCPNFPDSNELQIWGQAIEEIMFDENMPDSLISNDKQIHPNSEVKNQFSGATSVLTLMDLWQDLYPEGADVSVQIADEETDVNKKIDVIIETGTAVTLIQLKTNKFDDANIIPVTEIKGYLSNKVPEKHVVKMIQEQQRWKRKEKEKQENDPSYVARQVNLAIVEVPGIESDCVNNVFGKVNDPEKRSQLVEKMKGQAEKSRIIPVQQTA